MRRDRGKRAGVLWGSLGATLLAAAAATATAWGQGPGPMPGGGLGQPLPGLNPAELGRFQVGQRAFGRRVDPPEGLGPVFNDDACVKCHGGPAPGGGGPRLATRFGRRTGSQFDPLERLGGPLLQDRGIGRFGRVNFVGETVPREANVVAKRRTTPLFGLGLVDAVPDVVFVQLAQQQQQLSPATAGRPSPVIDPISGTTRVGKFGWKAQQPSLFAFSVDALVNEMGVTTPLAPRENPPQGNASLLSANPARTNPNQTDLVSVQQLADFMTLLAPPPPGVPTPDAAAGRNVFAALGCASCHQPTLQTGPSPVAALNGVTFAPYSDFLLHDMGALGDGVPQNQAGPREMRTAPLWGLRFQATLLHDGRARTPTDAILAHDGQARAARDRFNALTTTQKNQLLAFLNSL